MVGVARVLRGREKGHGLGLGASRRLGRGRLQATGSLEDASRCLGRRGVREGGHGLLGFVARSCRDDGGCYGGMFLGKRRGRDHP